MLTKFMSDQSFFDIGSTLWRLVDLVNVCRNEGFWSKLLRKTNTKKNFFETMENWEKNILIYFMYVQLRANSFETGVGGGGVRRGVAARSLFCALSGNKKQHVFQ